MQGELDVHEPLGGQGINLGGFDQLVHGHDHSNTPVIGWSIKGSDIGRGVGNWQNFESFRLELGFGRQNGLIALQTCSVSTAEGLAFRASMRSEAEWTIDTLDWDHPALVAVLESDGITVDSENRDGTLSWFDLLIAQGAFELETAHFLPLRLRCRFDKKKLTAANYWLFNAGIPDAFATLFEAFRTKIDDGLKRMVFVPPLRDLPARGMDFRLGGSTDWKNLVNHPDRNGVLQTLNTKLTSMGIRYAVHLRRLVAEETLIDRVESKLLDWVTESVASAETQESNWGALSSELGARLEDPWNSITNKKAWIEAHPDFHQTLIDFWEDIVRCNPDEQYEYFESYPGADRQQLPPDEWITSRAKEMISLEDDIFAEERTRILIAEDPELRATLSAGLNARKLANSLRTEADPMESRMEVRLRDLRHNVWVSLQDVGVGISQVLPVLIESVVSKNSLIAIEQPEIHIHPKLQAELGDVFIESALGENKNTFLLETHSEHLILRLLRRIRETTEGDFTDWPEALRAACPQGIKADDVAILYVEPGEEGATVIEMSVTSDGDFSRPWPGGFFAERSKELF